MDGNRSQSIATGGRNGRNCPVNSYLFNVVIIRTVNIALGINGNEYQARELTSTADDVSEAYIEPTITTNQLNGAYSPELLYFCNLVLLNETYTVPDVETATPYASWDPGMQLDTKVVTSAVREICERL